jgi:hypothetical protein
MMVPWSFRSRRTRVPRGRECDCTYKCVKDISSKTATARPTYKVTFSLRNWVYLDSFRLLHVTFILLTWRELAKFQRYSELFQWDLRSNYEEVYLSDKSQSINDYTFGLNKYRLLQDQYETCVHPPTKIQGKNIIYKNYLHTWGTSQCSRRRNWGTCTGE